MRNENLPPECFINTAKLKKDKTITLHIYSTFFHLTKFQNQRLDNNEIGEWE